MKILGLTTEYESGAATVEDGVIVAAVNEERLIRIKLAAGFPRRSIDTVLELSGWNAADVDAVMVAGRDDLYTGEAGPYGGWFEFRPAGFGRWLKRSAGVKLARFRQRLPFLEAGYYLVLGPSFARRRRLIRETLREDFNIECPIYFVDHHLCHATSAYFTSGFDEAIVGSLDGGGDGKSGRIYAVRAGCFEELDALAAFDSLGNYYAYVTHLCGFRAHRHEGKITGLAAHGEPRYVDLLEEFVEGREGKIRNVGGVVFDDAVNRLRRCLPAGWKKEDLAASVQLLFERIVPRWIDHWATREGLRDVAVAGGVFANVRVNQVVHESPGVDRLFVHPGMGDGGLAVGAALAACSAATSGPSAHCPSRPLPHVFLGSPIRDVEASLAARGLEPESLQEGQSLAAAIAERLSQGYVVARAAGRMEYGPRALGNRSVLYQPADPEVNDWLNRNLRRTEFMPFAPAVLWEHRSACFEGLDGAEQAAEFMTITFRCTSWMREAMPGVVHVDGTARPQLVSKEANPGFHEIISSFCHLTGLPGVVNTSFNIHEEPIVHTADDAVRAFLDARIDYLAVGEHLVKHPEPQVRRRVPVQPEEGAIRC